MTRKVDFRHPDILKEIGRMASCGMSWAGICDELEKQHGERPSPVYLKKIYETYLQRRTEVIEGDAQLKEDIKEEILNWKDQIARINKMTWDMLEDAESTPRNKFRAMEEVRKQLDLQNKILQRMESSLDQKEVNKIQMTQNVIHILKQLEREGMIKILRYPGQPIDVEAKEEENGQS